MVVLLLSSPSTADDDATGKQVDWLTSTAASLSRAQQHSAEYDKMAKSIRVANGAASIASSQEVHQPGSVQPQPEKDEHASGTLLYGDFAQHIPALKCLAEHVCREADNSLPICLC